jgi:signal transduction histidine kinase
VSEEKVRPFTLVKYFTYSSLAVIFLGILVLSILNAHWAKAMQLKKSEDYAHLLIENLNHQIFSQFVIPMAIKFGRIQLRNKEQFERLDKIVQSTFHSFKVDTVTIYDIQNVVSYSFDPELIGKEDVGGPEYYEALEGNASSALEQDGSFIEIFLGVPQKSKLITFAPLRAEKPLSTLSGPVMGVVEIVQDLSEDYKTIFRFQIRIMITCTVVMLLLFLILIQVVNRGEGIIRQRNAEQIRLKEQLSRAERLSALGEMIAGISHEIRNPLGIIRSSAELLRKKMLKFDPANTIPDIIVEESTRLNNIITDFLSVAKPKEPALRLCRIDEVLEKNIGFLASQLDAHGYRIERGYAEGLPEIMTDPDMLYQAFLNILMNAMQAMPDGGAIRIKTYKADRFITILFEDEGGGIPEEVLPKIWDPFFSTKETGTGLGLGIVKNIIESHRGKIHIQNGNAKGAQVRVELPITQEEIDGNHSDC